MDAPTPSNKVAVIKNLYLYLVSFVALLMVAFSLADVINITLKTYIFTAADQNYYSYPEPAAVCSPASSSPAGGNGSCVSEDDQKKLDAENLTAERERDLVKDISFIVVGLPLFLYHWYLIRKKEMN